jgi:DNA-directed DNA polymerase III PolC
MSESLNQRQPFTPLHCHSYHSLLEGTASVAELVSRAHSLGYKALALTDVNSTAGLILFHQECERQNIQGICGLELRCHHNPKERLVLLARNAAGYSDLCELVTHHLIHREQKSQKEQALEFLFNRPFPDLIVLCPHPALLLRLINTPIRPVLYGELLSQSKSMRNAALELQKIASEHHIPLCASRDVWFLQKQDFELHRTLRAIALNTTLKSLSPADYAPSSAWLKTPSDMQSLYQNTPDALRVNQQITALCAWPTLQRSPWILPDPVVPQGHTPNSYLKSLALQGLNQNYQEGPDYAAAKKIQEKELRIIAAMNYSGYFLMVRQIRQYANNRFHSKYRKHRSCTIMRGSAANCMTFYNIGASDLDPIRYNLYFERFLNEDRASPPDADLDFGWDERDEILNYFFETYGEDHVCILCTTNHFRWRSAFRETAKVYGYSEAQVTELITLLKPYRQLQGYGHSDPQGYNTSDLKLKKILETAAFLKGRPRFLSQHPGGVIVTRDPIWRHVGCQRSGGIKNRIISQIDMHNGIDYLGLVKFDILGNGSLSVLRDTLNQIEEQGYADPAVDDMETLFADAKVKAMMAGGDSLGIFYIESPAQMRLNTKAAAESFEEIGVTSSLVRPAGTAYAEEYVRRHRLYKQGQQDWDYLHPTLEPLLNESHDICVFQEDITRICVEIAGMSFAGADKVRKMMNSLREGVPGEYEKTAEEFKLGCMRTSGFSPERAHELWQRVQSFQGFSFCKSHSLSYAQLSFRCAYLKCYYPGEFMSAVISNRHGFYASTLYVDEARRMGLAIQPFDINLNRERWFARGQKLWPGFLDIRNLPIKVAGHIVAERNRHGAYTGLEDFVQRNPHVGITHSESLILVGAFEGFGLNQAQSLALLHELHKGASRPTLGFLKNDYPEHLARLKPYTRAQRSMHELQILGYMVSANLLDYLAQQPAARQAIPIADLKNYSGRTIRIFGIPVTHRTHRTSTRQELMMFLSLQDNTGIADTILWPNVYEKFSSLAILNEPMLISGRVQEDYGTYSLEVQSIQCPGWNPQQIDISSKVSKSTVNTSKPLRKVG